MLHSTILNWIWTSKTETAELFLHFRSAPWDRLLEGELSVHDYDTNPTQDSTSKDKPDGSTPGTKLLHSTWEPSAYYVSVGVSLKPANSPELMSVTDSM
jgi:hypothetical protein